MPPKDSTERREGMAEALKNMGSVADTMVKTFEVLWALVKRIYGLYASYPNKRVRHLALHAKRQRTRKKNMRRIARDLLKEAIAG